MTLRHLIVEGKNDFHFIKNLVSRGNFNFNLIEIDRRPKKTDSASICCFIEGGIDELLGNLVTRVTQSDVTQIGFVVDADLHLRARWESVRNLLMREGINLPLQPDPAGTVVALDDRRIGFWLMPDNRTEPGRLEDLCIQMIPAGDGLWPLAQSAVATAKASGHWHLSDVKQQKAEIHTWLAWQDEPGTPLGMAVGNGWLAHDSKAAISFLAWMRRVFIDE
jgi:hypothetical protein